MSSTFSTTDVWDPSRGEFINSKHERIAEVIADYDDTLRLVYVPRAERSADEVYPYAVMCFPTDNANQPYIIMRLAEEEVNETVLARLWAGDLTKHNANEYLAKLDAANEALKMREELDIQEQRAEMHERARSIFRTPLHKYRLGGGRSVNL
jgi:hypothetical protein